MSALRNVQVNVAVMLGSTRLPIREILKMGRGAVIPLDGGCDEPSALQVNGLAVALGWIKVVGEKLSLEVTEILKPGR